MRLLAAVVLALVAGCSAPGPSGELRVCLRDDDPPRSQALPPRGFDVDVGKLLAHGLGREFQPVWLAGTNATDVESSDLDFPALLNGRCDLQLSVPGADALGPLAGRLGLSVPYYGAGFELVPETARLALDSPASQRIAVRGSTVAHRYLNELGFDWTMRRDGAGVETAIRDGEAAAGLIWGPELSTLQISYNPDFEPPPALRWNLHAVTRWEDRSLREAIDEVLTRRDVAGDIQTLLRRHRMPPHPPFPSVHQARAPQAG